MKRKTLISAAVAVLLPAGLALAQQNPPAGTQNTSQQSQPQTTPQSSPQSTTPQSTRPSDRGSMSNGGGTFSSMDTNGDGRISRTEASSDRALGRGFSQADRNGDGYLDSSEYSSRSQNRTDPSNSESTTSDESSTNNPSPSNSPSDPPRQ